VHWQLPLPHFTGKIVLYKYDDDDETYTNPTNNRRPFKYFHIRRFYFHDHNTLAKITEIKPMQK
jgi:hypothetical protein